MALQAKQTTHQRLLLAPNITLALEVLRMPTMELQAFLRQRMEENPLLEMDEPEAEPDGAAEEEAEPTQTPEAAMDEDWASHWQQAASVERGHTEADPDALDGFLEQQPAKPQSFHEWLLLQLGCQPLPPEERRLGEALVLRLDEHGYLEGPLEPLAAELRAPLPQLEAALTLVQRLDPPGVGARDLRECLMLQLERAGAVESLAYRILRDQFTLFVHRTLSALAKATESSLQQVEAACAELKRLNPKPGRLFSGDLPPSVIPDLIIVRRERHDDVELNDQAIPRLNVSRAYARMLKSPQTPDDAKVFLAAKFRQATWLIKAIEERNATLLAIGRCLISLQREFVLHGPKALKPLTQAQVASLIGRHASTVSRAITGKTIDTPYGVFRLEQLFPSGIPQAPQPAEASPAISDATIKEEIRHLIAEEDARRPFSDEALARRLAERRIAVARRTVAKYRTTLRILPAHLRRRRL